MDKTQAVLEWAAGWKELDGYLKLNSLLASSGEAGMATVANDDIITEYISGVAERAYTLAFSMVLDWSDGYDSINQTAMKLASSWCQWVRDQDKAGNYPALPNVSKVEPLQNIPTLAMVYQDDSLAKYQFQVKISYRE